MPISAGPSWCGTCSRRRSFAKPRQWCFPIAGCVTIAATSTKHAQREAARFKAAGDDVYVGGVPAYSTLGYFDDPVLSTFMRYPETEVARLMFHELAHQVVYVKGRHAVQRVVRRRRRGGGRAALAPTQATRSSSAVRSPRRAPAATFQRSCHAMPAPSFAVYRERCAPDEEKRAAQGAAFAAMREGYELARPASPGLPTTRPLVRGRAPGQGPNNASIASVALYTGRCRRSRSSWPRRATTSGVLRTREGPRRAAQEERDGTLAAAARQAVASGR